MRGCAEVSGLLVLLLIWSCQILHTQACAQGSLRLINGSSYLEGRVELCYNDVWGTVCDDSWTTSNAMVVCRQLGLNPDGATWFSSAFFGEGSGPILLDEVSCNGSEATLLLCASNTIKDHDCSHSEDVGVNCLPSCAQGSLQLVNGSSYLEGHVELCYNDVWGTVCDDLWTTSNAMVVCRQLGLNPDGATWFSSAFFGEGSGPILLDEVSCNGSEATLLLCASNIIKDHDCSHSEDVGVNCLPFTTEPLTGFSEEDPTGSMSGFSEEDPAVVAIAAIAVGVILVMVIVMVIIVVIAMVILKKRRGSHTQAGQFHES